MEQAAVILEEYKQGLGRKFMGLSAMALALLFMVLVAVSVGSVDIPLQDVVRILLGQESEQTWETIIWKIRMPRVLTAVVAGMGLAVSGAAMQGILRNPIGSPFTLGISHAAAFGAAFAIVILGVGSTGGSAAEEFLPENIGLITVCAFLAAMACTAVIIFLAKVKGATPETMILTGVAMGSLFIAGTTALEYFAEELELASIIFWTFGDLGRSSWDDLKLMTLVVLPGTAYLVWNGHNYSVLDAGEETAQSLGVNVERVRILGMTVSALITAVVISFVGIIGFLGLVVPHMVRKVLGGDQRLLLIGSSLLGALLLLVADTAARTIIAPVVLPVGILTSFLGAPLFIFLVLKGRENW